MSFTNNRKPTQTPPAHPFRYIHNVKELPSALPPCPARFSDGMGCIRPVLFSVKPFDQGFFEVLALEIFWRYFITQHDLISRLGFFSGIIFLK
jgi:hypothetical protein